MCTGRSSLPHVPTERTVAACRSRTLLGRRENDHGAQSYLYMGSRSGSNMKM